MAILKAIVPKDLFKSPAFQKELKRGIDDTTRVMMADFRAVTRSWKHKPVFLQTLAKPSGADLVGSAGTFDKIFGYVTRGTEPHIIRPRRARALRFQTGYRAKTVPRVLGSHAGGAFGPVVFAQQVLHPGTKARQFEEEIAARRQRNLETNVAAAIMRARKG